MAKRFRPREFIRRLTELTGRLGLIIWLVLDQPVARPELLDVRVRNSFPAVFTRIIIVLPHPGLMPAVGAGNLDVRHTWPPRLFAPIGAPRCP
jgi:hypothetical protein